MNGAALAVRSGGGALTLEFVEEGLSYCVEHEHSSEYPEITLEDDAMDKLSEVLKSTFFQT